MERPVNTQNRRALVAAARGGGIADVVIRNVVLYNVLSATIETVDIGVVGERVGYVLPAGAGGPGRHVIEGRGLFALPGFIDGHVHNESWMVTPAQWAKALVVRGTTTKVISRCAG